MNRGRWVFRAWLASGAAAFACFASDIAELWLITGLVTVGWGLAVASNYRGAADAMPKRASIGPLWQETSRGMLRLVFAGFGLWGLGIFVWGTVRAVQ